MLAELCRPDWQPPLWLGRDAAAARFVALPADPTEEKKPNTEPAPTAQEPYIPKPPSPEALKEISRQQELITDEWTGDEPAGSSERGHP